MLEELWILFRAVLGWIAEVAVLLSGYLGVLAATVSGFLAELGTALGPQDGLFLPAGRGASILILGGIAMVAISLSIALYLPPSRSESFDPGSGTPGAGSGANGEADAWPRFSAAHADPRPDPAWLVGMRKVAARNGLDEVVLLTERSGRLAVAIPACSGPKTRQGAPTCEHARKLILNGLRSVQPQGRVVPFSCRAQGDQACVFEIRTGGEPS